MIVIDSNENGRIYVSSYQLRKITKKFIKENYKNIECKYVVFNQGMIEVGIHAADGFKIETLKVARQELIQEFHRVFNIKVRQLNIKIL
ncbi:MAG: hypothetical protein ACRCUP_07355 [Mycoplasmatales bacterium]